MREHVAERNPNSAIQRIRLITTLSNSGKDEENVNE
jgi:hypothetical protein